ncbi:MAG: GGDEF domain-containing protein [Chloroflexi bacterium]|nr:GGDEF domain-containing protein [Chloroflexota bacterium]MQC48157.1 GGDEF domain-containing protein [Chloroflexota bacterium]
MTFRIRSQWALITALLLSMVVLVASLIDASNDMHWPVIGAQGGPWALALALMTVGLAVQLMLNQRAAAQREASLERAAAQLREVSAELDRLARTDGLTGVANRRALFEMMGIEFRRSRRYERDLSVLMLDLDQFKQVNDRWGHPFGDQALQDIAHLVQGNIRESDILGRYGGEEFVVILPEANAEQAVTVAEKLRRAVESHDFRTVDLPSPGQSPVRITISIGVASTPVAEDQDEVELFSRADRALYEAKRAGRNRVVLYSTPAAETAVSRGQMEA